MTTVGFIGVGSQGAPMAQRIIDAGYPVVLWARRAESLAPFVDTNAEIADSIQALGRKADHVGICVVDDNGVVQIVEQLLPSLRAGSHIAIHSTVTPALCRELDNQAARFGIDVLDAPVSGGGQGAAAGTLTVMAGGDASAFAKAQPIFATFARQIVHLGPVGAGQTAKLVNNALMAANVALAHRALEAASALGIDHTALIELIKTSSGRSFGFEVRARNTTPASFRHGASLLAKDVHLLGESARDNEHIRALRDVAMPYLDLALNAER